MPAKNTHVRAELSRRSDRNNPTANRLIVLLEESRHIAVIGMSRDPAKAARRVPSYLAARGYEVSPINPFAERILGRPTYPDLASVEKDIDIVLIFRPSEEAGVHIEEAMKRPERPAIWLQEGIRDDAAATKARHAGFIVVQDLCIYKIHRGMERDARHGVQAAAV